MRGLDPARNWRSPLPQRCAASTACRPIRQGDAARLGRGQRSGIGFATFQSGGLVVDGGRGAATQRAAAHQPHRVSRRLARDCRARSGATGRVTVPTKSQPSRGCREFPAADAAHLCRLVMMQALPAAAEARPRGFGAAIRELQARIGDYFAPAQGGQRFTSPDVGAVLAPSRHTRRAWDGPKLVGSRPALHSRRRCTKQTASLRSARAHPRARGLDIRICAALNRGAEIDRRINAPEEAMADKNILHMVTPLKHMSPFDVNMALDAGYDAVLPYRRDARRDHRPGAGRDLLASAEDRRAHRLVHRRQERFARARHAGDGQEGAGAAVRHLVLRRSGRLVHHRRRDGRVRREGAEGQEEARPERPEGRGLRRHRRGRLYRRRYRRAGRRRRHAGRL